MPVRLVLLMLAACMPRYTYEQPTLPVPITSPAQRCYEDKKLALSAGEGSWTRQYGGSTGFVSYTVTEYWRSAGVAFRAGGSILPADQVVATLPDPDLAAAYHANLERTRGAHRSYPKWRNGALGIAFAGLGMALGGLAVTLANPDRLDGLWLAIGGAGVATLSMIPAVMTARTHEGAIEHDVDRHLFAKSEWAGRMVAAAAQHNRAVAASCGYDRPELALTPRVQQMVGATQAPLPPPAPGAAAPSATR